MKTNTVIEGTWEEIASRAEEFTGRRLRVTLLEEEPNGETKGADAPPSGSETVAHDFRVWAEGHSRTTPLLSEEAVSRESIYAERG